MLGLKNFARLLLSDSLPSALTSRARAQRRHALQQERTQVVGVLGLASSGLAPPLELVVVWHGGVVCMVWRYGMDRCARRARTYAVV